MLSNVRRSDKQRREKDGGYTSSSSVLFYFFWYRYRTRTYLENTRVLKSR